MSTIDGIEVFPIISLVIFMLFFAVLFYFVFTMRKSHVIEMEELPLENNDTNDNKNRL